jgi:hypothetical protein
MIKFIPVGTKVIVNPVVSDESIKAGTGTVELYASVEFELSFLYYVKLEDGNVYGPYAADEVTVISE